MGERTHLFFHLRRGKVGIHEIAEVLQAWEPPVAAIVASVGGEGFSFRRKQGVGDFEIRGVIDLVPRHILQDKGLKLCMGEVCQSLEYQFIVLVFPIGLDIGLQEWDVLPRGKFPAELIDIYRFIITGDVVKMEIFLFDKLQDIPILIQRRDGAHPSSVRIWQQPPNWPWDRQ